MTTSGTSTGFDGLRVDHAALDLAAQDLAATVAAVDDRLDRLEGDLAPLRSQWSGHAQEAYAQAEARWRAALVDLRDLLARTSVAVADANAAYAAADRRGAAAFGG